MARKPKAKRRRSVPPKPIRAAYRKLQSGVEKLFHWRSWDWLLPVNNKDQWRSVRSAAAASYSLIVKVPWIIAIAVIAIIIVEGLTQQTTVIEPISVPKNLADNGYTPEVAARRLRDALQKYLDEASSLMQAPGIAMHGELPDIIVPSVGISLDAVVASVRTVLHSTRSRTITGELTVRDDALWLHLRLDGRRIDIEERGVYPQNPDALFETAAAKIMDEIRPYLVAVWQDRHGNSAGALEKANEIIISSADDYNVLWAHNLRGNIYFNRNDDEAAKKEYQKTLDLDWKFAVAHYNLALVYQRRRDLEKAKAEYREAIRLNPKFSLAYNNLGILLSDPEKKETAFRNAIKYDLKYARAYWNLGRTLKEPGDKEAAFRMAIRFDPSLTSVYRELADVLERQDRPADAIQVYEQLLRVAPNDIDALNGISRLRRSPVAKAL